MLGVKPNASSEEIKTAYRKLQMKFHADKNGGKPDPFYEERSKELNEAYEILSHPVRRARYDKELQAYLTPRMTPAVQKKSFNWGNFALGAAATFILLDLFKGGKK